MLPFVRRSAAVGLDRGSHEGEQLYLFIEPRMKRTQGEAQNQEHLKEIVVQVVQRCEDVLGLRPGRVYLLKRGAIPMTDNGKIKYLHVKDMYMKGTLRTKGFIIFPQQ